jgi:predicted permease
VGAAWGSRLLVAQISAANDPVALDLSLHWRVLAFTAGVTLATTVLFGIGPALRAGRMAPLDAIKQQGTSLAGEGPGAWGGPLVVAQVALSLVLAFAAGLFVRTFTRLTERDLGLQHESMLVALMNTQRSAATPATRAALFGRVQEAVSAVPGVAGAAVSTIAPLSGMVWNGRFQVKDGPPVAEKDRETWANAVTPGFFATYGTPLRAGRDFAAPDRCGAPEVAIVNEAFARRFLGGQSPLGHLVTREGPPGKVPPPAEIVGLVGDAAYRSPREGAPPTIYFPIAQLSEAEVWPFASLGVRAAVASPALLAKDVAAAVGKVDGNLSLTFGRLSRWVDASLMGERLLALLSAFFGTLALLLAGIGLFGVTSYAVSRRRTEIGVRMALGAEASRVVRMILGRALGLVTLGLAIGAAASLWASRFVSSLLFGLEPGDLPTLAAAAMALLGVGLLSAGLPARRASRIDPASVLRE